VPRHGDVRGDKLSILEHQEGLAVAPMGSVGHAGKIIINESHEMKIEVEFRAISLVPKIGLIYAIATLTHIDGLNAVVQLGKLLAPGLVIADTGSQCERIAGAYDPEFPRRDFRGKIPIVPKAL